MKVTGKIRPLRDSVFVTDMEFDAQYTASGIFIPSSNGKNQGIHPRWGRVWAIGQEQKDITIGEWVLIEHGRWTRTVEVETETGETIEVRMVDNNAIMLTADYRPSDINRAT